MKCLNCGRGTEQYVCAECQRQEIWSNVFSTIYYYNEEKCDNDYVRAYV